MSTLPANPQVATHELRCVHCGKVQETADRMFRCTECSELLEVVYPEWASAPTEFALRLKQIWRERRGTSLPENASGVWRFRELLPQVDRQHIVTMSEGNTPLVPLKKAARELRLPHLLVKHQGMNPTGSFKDTGISAAITMAKAEGFSWVCCASTGNTSASVAAYAARAEMKSIVLLPAGQVTAGKLAQALEYGAHVLQLRTDFDGCLKVLHEVVRKFPAYLLNSLNPYRLEGQKTHFHGPGDARRHVHAVRAIAATDGDRARGFLRPRGRWDAHTPQRTQYATCNASHNLPLKSADERRIERNGAFRDSGRSDNGF